jgi:hypothetical protein
MAEKRPRIRIKIHAVIRKRVLKQRRRISYIKVKKI